MREAFRVGLVTLETRQVTSGEDIVSTTVVNISGREERDATVLVRVVVPREKLTAPSERVLDGG